MEGGRIVRGFALPRGLVVAGLIAALVWSSGGGAMAENDLLQGAASIVYRPNSALLLPNPECRTNVPECFAPAFDGSDTTAAEWWHGSQNTAGIRVSRPDGLAGAVRSIRVKGMFLAPGNDQFVRIWCGIAANDVLLYFEAEPPGSSEPWEFDTGRVDVSDVGCHTNLLQLEWRGIPCFSGCVPLYFLHSFQAWTSASESENTMPTLSLPSEVATSVHDGLQASGSFSDPDPGQTWTATADFGDGGGSVPLALEEDKTFVLEHRHEEPGDYLVKVSVTDSAGAEGRGSFWFPWI